MIATSIGPKIGAGRTAEIFEFGPGRILKLFRADWTEAQAKIEYENTLCADQAGLPVPKAFEMGMYEGRPGIVLERLEGQPLTDLLLAKPWKVKWGARLLAELHARVHGSRSDLLPRLKDVVEGLVSDSKDVDQHVNASALEMLRNLAYDDTICHGDFHPDNILVGPAGIHIIDWANATAGSRVYDFARTLIVLRIGIPEETGGWRRIAIRGLQTRFARIYAAEYRSLMDVGCKEFAQWTSIAVAVRLAEGIEAERKVLMTMLRPANA